MKTIILFFLLAISINAQGKFEVLGVLMDDGVSYEDETLAYITRVEADGGTVINPTLLNDFILDAKSNSYYDSLIFVVDANYGIKKDANNKITKIYDVMDYIDYFVSDTNYSPSWTASSQNGLAGNLYDGSNDFLGFLANSASANAQPLTVYLVAKALGTSGNFFDGGGGGRVLIGITGGKCYMHNGASVNGIADFTVGTTLIYSAVLNGANSVLYRNNISDNTGDTGSNGWGDLSDTRTYGMGGTPNGAIPNAVALTNIVNYTIIVKRGIGNVSVINTFLNSKYGIY